MPEPLKELPSQFCNANICAFCGDKFIMGITVWRMTEGWVHPECARIRGRLLEEG